MDKQLRRVRCLPYYVLEKFDDNRHLPICLLNGETIDNISGVIQETHNLKKLLETNESRSHQILYTCVLLNHDIQLPTHGLLFTDCESLPK